MFVVDPRSCRGGDEKSSINKLISVGLVLRGENHGLQIEDVLGSDKVGLFD